MINQMHQRQRPQMNPSSLMGGRPGMGQGPSFQKMPMNSMAQTSPVPQPPDNFQDYMRQLQKPLGGTSALDQMTSLRNKMMPYQNVRPFDLSSKMTTQLKAAQQVQAANQTARKQNQALIADAVAGKAKYQRALMEQHLAERAMYTRFAVDTLQRSSDRVQELRNMRVDPSRFFKDMSSWQKIVGFIGIAAAGLMHARSGYDPNEVLIGINNIIEADVQAQTRDLEAAKLEHQQMSIIDNNRLQLMATEIDARTSIRANQTALVLSEIEEMRNYDANQAKLSGYDDISKGMLKSFFGEYFKAQMAKSAIGDQMQKNGYAERMKEGFQQYQKLTIAANPASATDEVPLTFPGDKGVEEETEANGGVPPTHDPKTGQPLSPEKRGQFSANYNLKKMAREVNELPPSQKLYSLRESGGQNWQHKMNDRDAYNNDYGMKTLTGDIVYPSLFSTASETGKTTTLGYRDEYLNEVGLNGLLQRGARVYTYIGGLKELASSKVGDKIQWGDYDSQKEAAYAELKGLSWENTTEEQRKEIISHLRIPEGKNIGDTVYGELSQEILKMTGLTTDKNAELAGAIHSTIGEIRMLTAAAIKIVTGEEGARKSDKELAMAFLAVTAGKDISGIAFSKYNFKQRLSIIQAMAEKLSHAGVAYSNEMIKKYVSFGGSDGLPQGLQQFSGQFHLHNPTLYKNSHIINIIDKMEKMGAPTLWGNGTPFDRARKAYLDKFRGYVEQNKVFMQNQGVPAIPTIKAPMQFKEDAFINNKSGPIGHAPRQFRESM